MRKTYLLYLALIAFSLVACKGGKAENSAARTDTPTSGEASFVSDECFAPIMKEEADVFNALNIEATMNPIYKNEVDAIKLFVEDSVRLLISARELTRDEINIVESRKLTVRTNTIAIDGIALIVNRANQDSLISVSTLKKIMTGKILSWKEINPQSKYDSITVVFDNAKSSTRRFIQDSICNKIPLGSKIASLGTNQAVIDYVSKTPNSMGVIGVNWVSNPDDSTKLTFIKNIRVMSVSRSENPTLDNSYKPCPYCFAYKEYPLTRNVYMIVSDYAQTLPTGFVNFVCGDTGQRIIMKSGLLTATRPLRKVVINSK